MKEVVVQRSRFSVCDQGAGPPLLLVHGFPLNHSMWNSQIDEFSSDYRVIAPNLRGFGGSDVTPGTITMQQHADDLADILDAIDVSQPVMFCGLSMGGYIAWQFWQKFAPCVAGLILCDTRAVADTQEAVQGRLAMAERVVDDGPEFVADAMLPKLLAEATASARPDLVKQIREMILETAPQGIAAAQRGMAQRPDVTAWLPGIAVPAQVIVGRYDAISTCDEMRKIAGAIPNCRFAEIPDAGHLAPMENAQAVNSAMRDFLDAAG